MARGFLIGENYRDRIDRTISRVDGMVDGAALTQIPTRLQEIGGPSQKVFRICTFTGAWSIGDTKTVTFKNVTNTPNTASVTNLFFPVTNTATSNRDCAIAREGTAWYLIDVRMATASTVVMTDVTLSAVLNTSACTISIGKTLVTASVSYLRLE